MTRKSYHPQGAYKHTTKAHERGGKRCAFLASYICLEVAKFAPLIPETFQSESMFPLSCTATTLKDTTTTYPNLSTTASLTLDSSRCLNAWVTSHRVKFEAVE